MFRRFLSWSGDCMSRSSLRAFSAGQAQFQAPGPVHLDKAGEKWAQTTLKKMSLEQKVGQMFMIWSRAQFLNVNDPEYLAWRDALRKYHLGRIRPHRRLRRRLPLQERAAGSRAWSPTSSSRTPNFRCSSPPTSSADSACASMRSPSSRTPWPSAPPATSTSPASPGASPLWKPAPSACSGTGFPTWT